MFLVSADRAAGSSAEPAAPSGSVAPRDALETDGPALTRTVLHAVAAAPALRDRPVRLGNDA
jgi:hypothetical protein